MLIYANLFAVPEDALQMFAVKRMPPNMRPSELRYLYYLADVVRSPPIAPHYKPLTLVQLVMQPVPLFTKIRYVYATIQTSFIIYIGLPKLKSVLLILDTRKLLTP